MSDIKLGQLTDGKGFRDAVHVAVIEVCAGDLLQPGQKVYWDEYAYAWRPGHDGPDGVVDPFLKEPVGVGEWFTMLVTPGTTTTVRHAWEHPKFPRAVPERTPEQIQEDAHEQWCKEACPHH